MNNPHAMGALPPEKIDALVAKLQANPLGASVVAPGDNVYAWSGRPVGASASMEAYCSAIEDQLQYGTCTANAIVGACELYLKFAGRFTPLVDDLSRAFNYWTAGVLDKHAGQDTGRSPRSAVLAAQQSGLCKESTEPYTGQDITDAPSAAAFAEAAQHRVMRFSNVPIDRDNYLNTVATIKQALNDGFPVTMAFAVYRWLFDISGPRSTHYRQPGAINPTDPRADFVGNHEVVIVGFQDTNDGTGGYFLVRNSWSTLWGDAGYWAMPYAFVTAAYEFWAVEGFDGVAPAPYVAPSPTPTPAEPPLTAAQLAAARKGLADKGLGTLGSDGSFTFNPSPLMAYAATAILLGNQGFSTAHIAQTVGIAEEVVVGFLLNPASLPYLQAWGRVLK